MFLSIRADSTGGDRSPWGSFWFEPVPYRANGPVTGDAAMQLSAVYSCVRVLAESVASLPFILYQEHDDGGKERIRNHWLYRLFKRPNQFQNGFEFREMMQGHLALRGNAFAQIIGNDAGEVTDLLPIHPDRVRIEMLSDTTWRYLIRNADATETRMPRGAVFHLRGLSGNGITGMNPIEVARKAVASGIAMQDYLLRFFQNDARPGGWIEYPGNFATDEKRNQWRAAWQEQQTGANRGKTAVLEFGMKFHDSGIANDDAQFIESEKLSRSQIAGLFRVPAHMINDLEKATFSNVEWLSLDFVKFTLTPWLVRWEEAIEAYFIDPDSLLDVEFDTAALQRGDATTRSKFYHAGILDGWMTRNEARISENLNPLPGLDEPLRPLNMVEESDAEDAEAQGADAMPDGDPQVPTRLPAPDNNAPDSRLIALAEASAERIARKEAAMLRNRPDEERPALYAKHTQFVANALCVSVAAAERYCGAQLELLASSNLTEPEFIGIARARLARLAVGIGLPAET